MQAAGTAPTLVLFALVLPVFTFPLTPLMSMWSRKHEFQADAYAPARRRPPNWSARWSSCTATTPPP
jgi:hypothetical protein